MGDAKKEHIWEFVLILGLRRSSRIAMEIGEAKKGTYENLIRDLLEKDHTSNLSFFYTGKTFGE